MWKTRSKSRACSAPAKLQAERLEDRANPAVHTWNDTGIFWSTPSNWEEGVAPAPGEANVVIVFNDDDPTCRQDIVGLTIDQIRFETGAAITLQLDVVTNIDGDGTAADIIDNTGANAITGTGDLRPTDADMDVTVTATTGQLDIAAEIVTNGFDRGLRKDGPGTLRLSASGMNTYTGATTVADGTLILATNTPSDDGVSDGVTVGDGIGPSGTAKLVLNETFEVPDTSTVTVLGDGLLQVSDSVVEDITNLVLTGGQVSLATGGTLAIRIGGAVTTNVSSTVVSSISGSGNLRLNDAATPFTVAGGTGYQDLSVFAKVVGTGGLVKAGAGRLGLSADNTYTGATLVNAGILEVNGSQAGSPVTVAGGTLIGSGTVGLLTMVSGAVGPGDQFFMPPVALRAGNTALNGGTFTPRLFGPGGGPTSPLSADQLAVTGTVSLTGATLTPTHVGGAAAAGQTYRIIDNDGSDAVTGTFAGLPEGATVTVGGQAYTITYIGGDGNNDVVLTAQAPPNVPPVAGNDAVTTAAGMPVTFNPLANDADPDGDTGTLVILVATPANGAAVVNADRTITYTPRAGFVGTDTFTYTVTDARGGTATATVTATVTQSTPISKLPREFSVSADAGGLPLAQLFDPTGSKRYEVTAFGGGFTGGVRTASADFNADGVADLVVGTGPGAVTRVRVLDGKSQAELFSLQPFEESFTGGVFVAAGDANGDGTADLVISPDQGGGPRVRIFSGKGFGQLADFFGIEDTNFLGGARAAVGDVNGDGVGDLVIAAGFGGGPRVAVFDGKQLGGNGGPKLFGDFFAFETELRNGVYVAAGDLNGDGKGEVITGAGPGGGPRVSAFDGAGLVAGGGANRSVDFFGGDSNNRGGIRVAVKDLDGDDRADLLVGPGPGGGSRVTAYAGKAIGAGTPPELLSVDPFPGFPGGVYVG
ncbi:MAG TPA: Ig-like domain-containing protein [Gemmataceae bacterium]|nr:Ig-like domain-containing protein [Gemmataceae bacterium]